MKNVMTKIASVLLVGTFLTSSISYASRSADSGRNKAKLILYKTNKEGFTKKISGGGFLSKFGGKTVVFEITPAHVYYMTPGKGPKGDEKVTLSNLSFSFYESDWGYNVSWKFSATLTAENVSTLFKTVCNKNCLKKNADVAEVVAGLDASPDKTFSLNSKYSAYNGDRVSFDNREDVPMDLNFNTKSGEKVTLTIKPSRKWRLYNVDND